MDGENKNENTIDEDQTAREVKKQRKQTRERK